MEDTKLSNIPVFIEASTKKELMRKMFNTNFINQRSYNYQTPIKDGNKWVVWYFADIEHHQHIDDKKLQEVAR